MKGLWLHKHPQLAQVLPKLLPSFDTKDGGCIVVEVIQARVSEM
jgi:hypothetical protein